jgi:hypothetical protein
VTPSMSEAVRIWMQGAIAMGYLIVALFFVRFWSETRDRLFVFFATGFGILCIHRTMFALSHGGAGWDEATFALRLVGYLAILIGIIDRRIRPSAVHT